MTGDRLLLGGQSIQDYQQRMMEQLIRDGTVYVSPMQTAGGYAYSGHVGISASAPVYTGYLNQGGLLGVTSLAAATTSHALPSWHDLKAENERLKEELKEHDEIIEALSCDIEDIERLKAENERLTAENEKLLSAIADLAHSDATPALMTGADTCDGEGWVKWDGASKECPLPEGCIADIFISSVDGKTSRTECSMPQSAVKYWRWCPITDNKAGSNITAYRIVEYADGWIPFYATPTSTCPIPDDAKYEIVYRGEVHTSSKNASRFNWTSVECYPITKYRIVKEKSAESEEK